MNTHISLLDLENSSHLTHDVEEIVIPASLSKVCLLGDIFNFLKVNDFLKKISICDDYLDPKSSDVEYFCKRLSEDFSNLEINWIREMKLDGRHGR
jgi:hypothetical protein